MRKIIIIIICILSTLVINPTPASADRHNLNDIDMSIYFDETIWYVFTFDNLENNPELDNFEVTAEGMRDYLIENDSILYATLYIEDEETALHFLIRYVKYPPSADYNLHEKSSEEIDSYIDSSILSVEQEGYQVTKHSIYKNDYVYSLIEYTTDQDYLLGYFTTIKGITYSIVIQREGEFTSFDKSLIKPVLDSIVYGDEVINNDDDNSNPDSNSGNNINESNPLEDKDDNMGQQVIINILIGVTVLAIIVFIVYILEKYRQKKIKNK